jgi:large subunit ribosomal protein L13
VRTKHHYTIDAKDRLLGRLASDIAILLRGKNHSSFDPSKFRGIRVAVKNTDRIRVSGKKMEQKLYRRHSGYPGALKEETLKNLFRRDSRLVLRRAVMGMLPKNKLRKRWIHNLILLRGEET